ncbi:MAG: carboxylating nicotinate-nucleotide diphosphorylase [Bacteroidetes bacterium]|nr:carboxylating nicotinate-nucleotide diphosphorylase [Bacteroidota bacterium]
MDLPDYIRTYDLDRAIAAWLLEDVGTGDVTTAATIPGSTRARAELTSKAPGTVAGLRVAEHVFHAVDESLQVQWETADGERVESGQFLGAITGSAAAILVAERLALNILQRMSGIATLTAAMVDACGTTGATILDTRKTAPGLRLLDKWAVLLGGGENHRIGLFDMIMVKDNHIAAAGGIAEAVGAADRWRREHNPDLEIELEARTLEEVRVGAALEAVDRLLLDNMVRIQGGRTDTTMLEQAIKIVAGRKSTEASGNVTIETVPAIAATGVNFISSGALTHSVQALDISLSVKLS